MKLNSAIRMPAALSFLQFLWVSRSQKILAKTPTQVVGAQYTDSLHSITPPLTDELLRGRMHFPSSSSIYMEMPPNKRKYATIAELFRLIYICKPSNGSTKSTVEGRDFNLADIYEESFPY